MRASRPILVPAILGRTRTDVEQAARRVVRLGPLLHYDVADGQFVPLLTPPPGDFPKLPEDHSIIWHLMVEQPVQYLPDCLAVQTALILIHAEAQGVQAALDQLHTKQTMVGLVLNPKTRVADCTDLIDQVDLVQVMTVQPGAQGQPFEPALLSKIGQVLAHRKLPVAVDGGVNSATIEAVIRYQPAYIAVGSAVTNSPTPVEAWQTLQRLVTIAAGGVGAVSDP